MTPVMDPIEISGVGSNHDHSLLTHDLMSVTITVMTRGVTVFPPSIEFIQAIMDDRMREADQARTAALARPARRRRARRRWLRRSLVPAAYPNPVCDS